MDGCVIGDMMRFKDGVVGKQIGSCSRHPMTRSFTFV